VKNDTAIKLLCAASEGEFVHECGYELLQAAEISERLDVPKPEGAGEYDYYLIEGNEEQDVVVLVSKEGPTEAYSDLQSLGDDYSTVCEAIEKAKV